MNEEEEEERRMRRGRIEEELDERIGQMRRICLWSVLVCNVWDSVYGG